MKQEIRSREKIVDDIKTAGQSFLGQYMEDLLVRYKELEDRELKNKLIEDYYQNQIGFYDKDITGTRTRVNAAIRIIRSDQVVYALEQIDGQNPLVRMESHRKALETLKKIKSGNLTLPILG